MNEAQWTQFLMTGLRNALGPRALVTKHHADPAVPGFPDVTFVYNGVTSYVEVKCPSSGRLVPSDVEPMQAVSLAKRWAAGAPAWLVVNEYRPNRMSIMSGPDVLRWVRGEAERVHAWELSPGSITGVIGFLVTHHGVKYGR